MQLKDLRTHPHNPRKITPEKLDLLRKSLAAHGDVSGITFNRRTKRLTGGNQRVKILPLDAKIELIKEFDPPSSAGTVAIGFIWIDGEPYFYREIDVDQESELSAMIAANKGAGEWDFKILNDHLLYLDEQNYDLELTMFGQVELIDILAPTKPPRNKKTGQVQCPQCGITFTA
jgi:hypothetical protein